MESAALIPPIVGVCACICSGVDADDGDDDYSNGDDGDCDGVNHCNHSTRSTRPSKLDTTMLALTLLLT